MAHRVAFFTFGIFREGAEHPKNRGFFARNDAVLRAAEKASGFIARSGAEDEPDRESWGAQVYPRFYVERGDGWTPAVLSLWHDLESVMAFSYSGLHGEALSLGRRWFKTPEWPPYVAWWVAENEVPIWADAAERHEYLHDHGPSAFAFNFKQPFDANGDETTIDRDRMKALGRVRG